jgi:hypothetical protein
VTRSAPKAAGVEKRIEGLERSLDALERRLVGIQGEYEERTGELTMLRSLARQIAAHGLAPVDTASWAACCRALGWPVGSSGAHRTVRRLDPGLHALLHRAAFAEYCPLDRASYAG